MALDGLAALVVVALGAVAVLAVRRRVITRRGGTFDCSLRLRPSDSGKGWALGIGRYSGDSLEWYRVFSYATRPRHVMARRELEIVDRRVPEGAEAFALLSGAVIVRCRDGSDAGAIVEFAMGDDALTGFLSWLEAAPPGESR
ncbi:MAG: hypothetical protein QOG77_1374 [Solirubrobacteraceae bacterium]|nr:hypothetical protein [Solirubrobacteraceae bacterium]